jgi:hypothetical protein
MTNQTVLSTQKGSTQIAFLKTEKRLPIKDTAPPEILFITSYPPRECGIATYSQDLIKALNNKFGDSFSLTVCALEAGNTQNVYPNEVKYPRFLEIHSISS